VGLLCTGWCVPLRAAGMQVNAAPADDQEEEEDVVVNVPQPAKANNGFAAVGVPPTGVPMGVTPTSTEVGGDTPPDEWNGALNSDADTDMDVAQAPDVDWLATGAMPTSSRDAEEFNLEFERSSSSMSGLSALGRGISDSSLTNLIPSPRGWDTSAPAPIPGANDEPATTVGHGTKRPRTSSSPRLVQPRVKAEAFPPDGSTPGSGEHMVHMVQHNQIPAGVIEKALPAELAFALLDSKNFEPGPRPALFDAANGQFLFKEKTVNGKPVKPGGSDAAKADRWHNSGGACRACLSGLLFCLASVSWLEKLTQRSTASRQVSKGAVTCHPIFRLCGDAMVLWCKPTAQRASDITSTPACGSSRHRLLMARGR
jgi:hypothetical protein